MDPIGKGKREKESLKLSRRRIDKVRE